MFKNFRLIASPTSAYARKVRIVMAEKRIECELEMMDVWAPDTRIQEFNPLGQVPCLIMEDGGAVFDSRTIVEYLDALTPVSHLIPSNGRERVEVRTWEALADGLLDAAVLVRLETTLRAPQQQSAVWIERQMSKVRAGLRASSKELGEKAWCNGQGYTLADIALGCALGWLDFRFPSINWRAPYPNLTRHYEKLAARPSFVETAPPPA
ncbi:MAG TPA: glutathione S-transferase C-terminal domain-containing protein [Burkholderiaceae bacterium]